MPKSTDIGSEALILAAARQVFLKQGYSGTRMQDIAEEAGINKALLHYYFRSKDKLFNHILEKEVLDFLSTYASLWLEPKPLIDKLEAIMDQEAKRFLSAPHIPMFLMHELSQTADLLQQKMVSGPLQNLPRRAIVKQIEDAVATQEIRPIEPAQLLVMTLSMALFPFLAKPIIQFMLDIDEDGFEQFIAQQLAVSKTMLRNHLTPTNQPA
jgi:AcrR family transcriptional regulator